MLYVCNAAVHYEMHSFTLFRHALKVASMTHLGFHVPQEDYVASRVDIIRRCNYVLSRVMDMRSWLTVLNATMSDHRATFKCRIFLAMCSAMYLAPLRCPVWVCKFRIIMTINRFLSSVAFRRPFWSSIVTGMSSTSLETLSLLLRLFLLAPSFSRT